MSKTWLWWFKFGIGGFYSNINEGWDESCIAHQLEEAHAPGMKPLSTAETAECVLPEVRTRACYWDTSIQVAILLPIAVKDWIRYMQTGKRTSCLCWFSIWSPLPIDTTLISSQESTNGVRRVVFYLTIQSPARTWHYLVFLNESGVKGAKHRWGFPRQKLLLYENSFLCLYFFISYLISSFLL